MKVRYEKLISTAFEPIIENNLLKIFANQILDNDYFTVSYSVGIKIILPDNFIALLLPASDCTTRKLTLDNTLVPLNLKNELVLSFSKNLSAAHINMYQPGECIAQLLILQTHAFTLQEQITLSEKDFEIFENAINNPPQPNNALKQAMQKNF